VEKGDKLEWMRKIRHTDTEDCTGNMAPRLEMQTSTMVQTIARPLSSTPPLVFSLPPSIVICEVAAFLAGMMLRLLKAAQTTMLSDQLLSRTFEEVRPTMSYRQGMAE